MGNQDKAMKVVETHKIQITVEMKVFLPISLKKIGNDANNNNTTNNNKNS